MGTDYKQYGIIGNSPALLRALSFAEKYARHNDPIIIVGEPGVGKELFARIIHYKHFNLTPDSEKQTEQNSNPDDDENDEGEKSDTPLVVAHMGSVPESLYDSFLFGHRKGAFTGACDDTTGYLSAAKSGTLFLDEIGTMPLSVQPKLLRALESREFKKVGSTKRLYFNARVICATNIDLRDELREKRFRRDLYDRLAGLVVEVPPLRERKEDIPLLVQYFLDERNTKLSADDALIKRLQEYDFPGNVRELKNIVTNLAVLAEDGKQVLTLEDTKVILESRMHVQEADSDDMLTKAVKQMLALQYSEAMKEFERHLIQAALDANNGNVNRTAERLGINQSTLHRKLKEHRIRKE